MAFEKYTVNQFKAAWFEKDTSVISESDFKIVYAEYQDASGLYLTDDFEKCGYIQHLNSRINYVKIFVRIQREFIKEFDMPYIANLKSFKTDYGYNLEWFDDLEDFEDQLQTVEKRERKNIGYLNDAIKELNDSREKSKSNKEPEPEEDLKKSRMSFIRMVNSLGKIGYKIEGDKTTIEEFSLMIKQQMEEVEQIRNR